MPKKKRERIEILEEDPNAIIVDGKKFRLAEEKIKIMDHHYHGDKLIFEPVDEKEFQKDVDFIVGMIEVKLDKTEVLREIVKQLPLSEIKKIRKLLMTGKRIKKTKGCVSITIGDDSKGAVISIA
jgi:hypothetical protein